MYSTGITWALHTLENLGMQFQNPAPEIILQTPWSSVCRFDTDHGYYYLKQVPPGLSLEPQFIHLLRESCGAYVPVLVADNPQTHCFLMQDAGIPLRQFFKQGFDAKLFMAAIHDYITVQQQSIPHLDHLLKLGVSDWRLAKIPTCYVTLIQQEKLLIADGLTSEEIEKLSKLTPKLVLLCEQLSQYQIPDTFSHNDFHDNNVLIDPATKQMTLVDLGEVAVTHPFFSLL